MTCNVDPAYKGNELKPMRLYLNELPGLGRQWPPTSGSLETVTTIDPVEKRTVAPGSVIYKVGIRPEYCILRGSSEAVADTL